MIVFFFSFSTKRRGGVGGDGVGGGRCEQGLVKPGWEMTSQKQEHDAVVVMVAVLWSGGGGRVTVSVKGYKHFFKGIMQ